MTGFHTVRENQFDTALAAKAKAFPAASLPARTAIGVNGLAGFDFEIKVLARLPLPAASD